MFDTAQKYDERDNDLRVLIETRFASGVCKIMTNINARYEVGKSYNNSYKSKSPKFQIPINPFPL